MTLVSYNEYPLVIRGGMGDNDYYQLVLRNDGFNFGRVDNGDFTQLWEGEIKAKSIIQKVYKDVVTDDAGQFIIHTMGGYRIISAIPSYYAFGCIVSAVNSIRCYTIAQGGGPVRADNTKIGDIVVFWIKD